MVMRKFSRCLTIALVIFLIAGSAAFLSRRAVGNLVGLAMEPVYIVPKESSIWSFEPKVMNTGSGDWWIYAEDAKCYYYFEGSREVAYHTFRKTDVPMCPDFASQDHRTWCPGLTKRETHPRVVAYWEKSR